VREHADTDADPLAASEFELAKVLWDADADRPRLSPDAELTIALDAWIAARG
jgi:hypothetical protein